MRLNQTWVKHLLFTLVEHGFIRVLDALSSILLIRILGSVHFGMYASYQSWIAMLLIFLPYVELALFRNYGKWKTQGELYKTIAAYKRYNFIKVCVALGVVALLSLYPQPDYYYIRFLLLTLALMIPLSQSLYGMDRDPLRFEQKQHVVTLVSSLQKATLIVGMLASFYLFPGQMIVLVPVCLLILYAFGKVWAYLATQIFPREKTTWSEAKPIIVTSLASTGIWLHFVQVVRDAVFTVDLFALSFSSIDIEEIGRYSIALKSANFFQMVPIAVASAFAVYLGKISAYQDRENFDKARKLTVSICIGMVFLCALFYFVGIGVERPVLAFVGKNKLLSDGDFEMAGLLYRWRLLSFMFYASFLPLTSYLVAKMDVKKYCIYLVFPWMAFSLLCFIWTSQRGVLLTAQANLFVYAVHHLILLVLFIRSKKLRPSAHET